MTFTPSYCGTAFSYNLIMADNSALPGFITYDSDSNSFLLEPNDNSQADLY